MAGLGIPAEPFLSSSLRPLYADPETRAIHQRMLRWMGDTLAWVRTADVTALRRLQLGAEAHRCWTVLFRPVEAMSQSSPAALRFRLSAGQNPADIQIDVHKCRGRRPASFLV